MTNDDLKFLSKLSEELRTQDNCGTADPYFFTIHTKQKVYTPDGCGDFYEFHDSDRDYSKEEFIEELFDYYDLKKGLNEYKVKSEMLNETDPDSILFIAEESFKDFDSEDYGIAYYNLEFSEHRNVKSPFLTRKSAEQHLQANAHHYSKDAFVYCNYAFRNPELERLVKILKNTDWSKIKTE